MKQRICLLILAILALAPRVGAQSDGLDLPSDLYILLNSGIVQRIGQGDAGVFAATDENVFVIDFAPAPDYQWLAYRTEEGLFLRHIDGTVSPVEGATAGLPPFRGSGATLAWSPAADALAYTMQDGRARIYFPAGNSFVDVPPTTPLISLQWSPNGEYLVTEAQNPDPNAASNFWWVYRRDGRNFTLQAALPTSRGVAWAGDTVLIFTPAEGGVWSLDLGAGNAQTALIPIEHTYALPYYRASDGAIVCFLLERSATDGSFTGRGTFTFLAADGTSSTPQQATPVLLDDVRWIPGGDLLLAFRGGTLSVVSPANGVGFTLPFTSVVAYEWGAIPPAEVDTAVLPAEIFFISDYRTQIAQLWRLPRNGEQPAFPFTSAEAPITEYAISRDGQRAAYVSGGRLFVQSTTPDAAPVPIATISSDGRAYPTFNANGTQVAYVNAGLWVADATGATSPTLLAEGDFATPQYAPNLGALLAVQGDQPALVDITSGTITPFGSLTGLGTLGGVALWLSDGRIAVLSGEVTYLFDPNNLAAPVASYPLPAGARIVSVREINGALRIAVQSANLNAPATVDVLEMNLSSGVVLLVNSAGFVAVPQLAPDATFAAGYLYRQIRPLLRAGSNAPVIVPTDTVGITPDPTLQAALPTADPNVQATQQAAQTALAALAATLGDVRAGPLLLRDLTTGETFTLRTPGMVWDVQWGE